MSHEITRVWRACQERLTAAERRFAIAMFEYCRGQSPPPSANLRAELFALRNEAHKLLAEAMQRIADEVRGSSVPLQELRNPSLPQSLTAGKSLG